MQLPLQNFTTLVQNMAAGVQGASASLLDLTVGSVLRAVLEASASVALWMQWLILQVLSMTRAATSNGADLDSWMADFSITRLPAAPAVGIVTFARYTTGAAALIPAGALVRTTDGTQSFAVTAVTSNPAWVAASGGYAVPAAVPSIDLPVQAVVAGSAGNVQAGAITQLATAIPGIDTVVNAAALQNGLDAETDAALRARFQNDINSRSRSTAMAVAAAIAAVQQGLRWSVIENRNQNGAAQIGNFVVTVDDGSGSPPTALLTTVQQAVEAVRPLGTTYTVQGPGVLAVTITLAVETTPAGMLSTVGTEIVAAVTSYVNALPIGAALPLSRVVALAHGADASVTSVPQVLINGVAADLQQPPTSVLRIASVTVS